jgi:translation initiation factor 4G
LYQIERCANTFRRQSKFCFDFISIERKKKKKKKTKQAKLSFPVCSFDSFSKKEITFRKILLNTCQEEFEGSLKDKDIKLDDPDEMEVLKSKQRRRKLGNIKLIGELFKHKLLSERIVSQCVESLLNNIKTSDSAAAEYVELNSERLCKLLATTGALMENERPKALDGYFEQIKKFLTDDKRFSSRIRFMFKVSLHYFLSCFVYFLFWLNILVAFGGKLNRT